MKEHTDRSMIPENELNIGHKITFDSLSKSDHRLSYRSFI